MLRLELSRKLPFGDPLGAGTHFGAMVTQTHLEKVASYVAAGVDEGAELLLGSDMVDAKNGNFFAPTVFDKVRPDMKIAQEEIFGPVLATIGFDTPEEAVALANGTRLAFRPASGRAISKTPSRLRASCVPVAAGSIR